jgi:hydroxyacyl-ACP dehydratase HTD2-like protein with hotdog domain
MPHTQALRISDVQVGDDLPGRDLLPDTIQLFLYNAALWNAHRIHFDEPYATKVEGYPALVVPGPLLGDWLNQCVEEWVGEAGRLASIEYSNRLASYVGETLHVGGSVVAVDTANGEVRVEVFVRNSGGEVVAPGTATVLLEPA